MVSPSDRTIILNLVVQSEHPAILEGLDVWLRLGLLSDETVLQICADHLTCLLSEAIAVRSGDDDRANDFTPEEALIPVGAGSVRQSPIARGIQSFMAEVSVIWLLFLGVFMVVVSSGVLAATQWRNFSPVGQYGILFAYTLAFWAASAWTGRQPSLRLTARMLQLATLLIIPVNFWTMDGFHLWQSGLGWLLAAIAALVLTSITVGLLKPEVEQGQDRRYREWLPLGMAIALSWLHWGWGWTGLPLVATYVGTIGGTIALVLQDREAEGRRQKAEAERAGGAEGAEGTGGAEGSNQESFHPSSLIPHPLSLTPHPSPLSLSTITIAIATLLLIARAVFAAGIPINRLGLAVGVCGWLLCWLGRRDASRIGWQRGGLGLLLAGWFIAVTVTPPWQAIAISGLGLWLLADYLRRSSQMPYLSVGWLVGLQTVWLLWRAVPVDWQQHLIETSIRLGGQASMPDALLGLWFFPYLVLTVWLALRLRHWQKSALAKHAELLALVLGIALTAVSFGNGLTRSLNLVFSTLTLVAVLRGRTRPEAALINLTHGTGLAAIASLINLWLPVLSHPLWAALLLIGAIVEWSLSASLLLPPRSSPASPTPDSRLPTPIQIWQQSTWHFGLVLAGISYVLLRSAFLADAIVWGSLWLVTPIALTILGSRRRLPQRRVSSGLSVVALFLVQGLLFDAAPERLTGLGAAAVLMFINTHQLRHWLPAAITIGFGLAFTADAIWESLRDSLTVGLSVNLLAIAILFLWLLRGWLKRRETVLATLYQQATDGWAIALAILTLTLLTLCHLVVYMQLDDPHWQYLSAAVVLGVATSYRTWRGSQNAGFYAIAWSLELIITGIISLTGRSLDAVAIANLALGLATQLLGDWWMVKWGGRRQELKLVAPQAKQESIALEGGRSENTSNIDAPGTEPTHPSSFILHPSSFPLPSSWHLLPLLYALVGLFLQHRSFTSTTGLSTLAAALVGMGVGRRRPFKPLVYLSVLGGSIAAYELLIYQLAQAKVSEAGDGLVLLAALAAAIAIGYRLLEPWLALYLRLSVLEVAAIASLHWGLGSALLPLALVSSLSDSGTWRWTGITAILAAYALAMGRGERGERRGVRSEESEVRSQEMRGQGDEGRGGQGEGLLTTNNQKLTTSFHPSSLTSPLTWTYAGIVEAIAAIAHLLDQLLPAAVLPTWGGTIAAGLAFGLYQAPWHHWGWQREPWQRSMAVLPAAITLLTAGSISVQGLLIVAAFYAWLAKAEQQVRLSYLSVLLADWAVLRWLHALKITEPLWFAALFSASLLYFAQVDPGLRSSSDRDKRHLLRCLATGLVCLTAFYQAEVGISGAPALLPGFLSGAIALGFVLAGLWLRIRAFLFVGTAVFMIQVIRQIVRFTSESLPLWSMGIVLGIAFIWVAATFEARRTQISSLMHYWSTELETWE